MAEFQAIYGGEQVGEVLRAHQVPFVFTLCGGHISPILVGCRRRGIRVIDVRHEATAVFAADAVARLSGRPGVAVVTAGPGVTNTITAVKNAQLAQSPVVLLGGATATALKGRGALQDIDQRSLMEPHVKWAASAKRVRDLAPLVHRAFEQARRGVPGPVFVECPVDLLYPERVVRDWYRGRSGSGGSLSKWLLNRYLKRHVDRLFATDHGKREFTPSAVSPPLPDAGQVRRAAFALARAERPVLLVGSQALMEAGEADTVAGAVAGLGVPVFLSGMARGLLGRGNPLQFRHKRKDALRDADVVILGGLPSDFRLGYGRQFGKGTTLIAANRSCRDLRLNRSPDLALHCDAGRFLRQLADRCAVEPGRWDRWQARLRAADDEKEREIERQSLAPVDPMNPLRLCREIDQAIDPDGVVVADGGDFVATASYIVRPRGPLSWLDPGVFGTLGVGAGFALGAKLCRPLSQVWLLYGDGSAGYSVAEFDTFVRHNIPVLAVVGNDASWAQIARDQVDLLGDDVGCNLLPTDYHRVAEGFGGAGFLLRDEDSIAGTLRQAVQAAKAGRPVLINARIGKTDFRKGSISI
jgi:acetolactate synthase-1/2/3 large subunit